MDLHRPTPKGLELLSNKSHELVENHRSQCNQKQNTHQGSQEGHQNVDDLHQSFMQSGLSLRGPRSFVQKHPLIASHLASLSKGKELGHQEGGGPGTPPLIWSRGGNALS